jgi:hypothetical protein
MIFSYIKPKVGLVFPNVSYLEDTRRVLFFCEEYKGRKKLCFEKASNISSG